MFAAFAIREYLWISSFTFAMNSSGEEPTTSTPNAENFSWISLAPLKTVLLENLLRGGPGQKGDQRACGVLVRRRAMDRAGKHRQVLKVSRKRPDDVDALHGQEFAQLMETDLGFAAHDLVADRNIGPGDGCLRLYLIVHAELLEHADQIGAARAFRVADGFRREQRFLERVGGVDVRPRRAGAHRNPDSRFGKNYARGPDEVAVAD